jgi:putative transposase
MWTQADRDLYKDDGRRYPSDLTDAQWALIAPMLSSYDPLKVDLREMVNACLYLEKTGCSWRYLPSDFGPWATVRTWHDRFRADGIWSEVATLLTRAVRRQRGRPAEPSTAILDSQSVVSGPQAGIRGTDGKKKVRGIKRYLLTCSRGFVLAAVVTAANVHDTQAAGWRLDRAAEAGWKPVRVKADGIYTGARMDEAAARHGVEVQVSTREAQAQGFQPLPLRGRIEATFGTLSTRYRRLTRHWEQSPVAAEDAISIANCHRLMQAYERNQCRYS